MLFLLFSPQFHENINKYKQIWKKKRLNDVTVSSFGVFKNPVVNQNIFQ